MSTVAELEAKILAGQTVTADEMAVAIADEQAAGRITELTRRREQAAATAQQNTQAHQQLTALETRLNQLITNDAQGVALLAQLATTAANYQQFIRTRNQSLQAIRTEARRLAPFGPAAAITVEIDPDGFSQIGNSATNLHNFETELVAAWERALAQAVQNERRTQ